MSLDTTRLGTAPAAGQTTGDHSPRWLRWDAALDGTTTYRLILGFTLLGMLARLVRYLTHQPLWGDEAFVAANFLDRSYADMLGPLAYHQVAPPLFLWLELAMVQCCGYDEWSLRLVPFLASVGGLLLFRQVATRLFSGWPAVLAVAIYAVSFYVIRYGVECKQYSTDLLAAMILWALAVECYRRPGGWGWIALAAIVPGVILLSYPAIFVAGGVTFGLAWTAWQSRTWKVWVPFALYNVLAVGTFLILMKTAIAAQYGTEGYMQVYWQNAFPPLSNPLAFVGWFCEVHTGHLLPYPIGGKNGGSTLSFLLLVIGLVTLYRQRSFTPLALCLGPFILGFAAAALHRYPYGGSPRVVQYLVPGICLLLGSGLASVLAAMRTRAGEKADEALKLDDALRADDVSARAGANPGQARRLSYFAWLGQSVRGRFSLSPYRYSIALASLALMAGGLIVFDGVRPYKTWSDEAFRRKSQAFWEAHSRSAIVACVRTDLGVELCDPRLWEWGATSLYRCNQRLHSPQHAGGNRVPDWSRVQADRPLRCVVFWRNRFEPDPAKLAAWLASMRRRFTLVRHTSEEFARFEHEVYYADVYEFVPQVDDSSRSTPPVEVAREASGIAK